MRKKGWDVNPRLHAPFTLPTHHCMEIGSFLGRKDIFREKGKKGINI